jgi:hypothetical protein
MYRMPLQQMVIKYTVSTTNKKVYTEEEDRFLLVMLNKYGVEGDLIYEQIRDEIRESPLFRFDWFFLSRTPQEIGRRCNTLIQTVVRELGGDDMKNGKGGKRAYDDEDTDEEEEEPVKKKAKNGVKVCMTRCDAVQQHLTHNRTSNSMLSRARHLQRQPLHLERAALCRTDPQRRPKARARRNRNLRSRKSGRVA